MEQSTHNQYIMLFHFIVAMLCIIHMLIVIREVYLTLHNSCLGTMHITHMEPFPEDEKSIDPTCLVLSFSPDALDIRTT